MILIGDVLDQLATLDDESVQMVCTSPPYWGLRDYGTPGQLGLEPTPEEYITKMVKVFQEVRRVLRKDGTLWLNMGDSYAGSGKGPSKSLSGPAQNMENSHSGIVPQNLKPKDLIGTPWRVALALQADGWWLRCDIIWSKPNPMPESVTDRPTKAHEYIFLLTKSAKYYYDAEAIKINMAGSSIQRLSQESFNSQKGGEKDYQHGTNVNRSARKTLENLSRKHKRTPSSRNVNHDESDLKGRYPQKKQDAVGKQTYTGFNDRYEPVAKVNRRSVWEIPTQPYPEAHFATFPEMIPRLCILAGSKRGDTILDPFLGSGTTGLVAQNEGRDWIGIELNAEYAELARKRTEHRQELLNL